MTKVLTRKQLIIKYLKYDNQKKHIEININNIDWKNPESIDKWLSYNNYKNGINHPVRLTYPI